jgi:outer membrane receptor protein involved in Fe transport
MRLLCAGASLAALAVTAMPAAAQTAAGTKPAADAPRTDVQEVIVTGSRIESQGFESPTPVVTIGQQELKNTAPAIIADAIQELPQNFASTGRDVSSRGTGTGGGQPFANLRGLGSQRTLTLLDGKRFVTGLGAASGAVDISQFPNELVKRVDVVTGGASAAYGSDAIAGVVNVILDHKFSGVSAMAQGGTSEYGDSTEAKASLAVGTDFGGGRGHLELSGDYYHSGDPIDHRPWLTNSAYITANGVGTLFPDVRFSNQSQGGVFVNSPTSGGVRGIGFNSAGQGIPFNYGQFAPVSTSIAVQAAGGDGNGIYTIGFNIGGSLEQKVFYGRLSWDLNDNWNVYAEGNLTDNHNEYNQFYPTMTARICPTNAFLPANLVSLVPACVGAAGGATLGKAETGLGRVVIDNDNKVQRAVLGFEGLLGKWSLDGYYTHGRLEQDVAVVNDLNVANYARAVNAVSSNGSIVCADTLSAVPATQAAAAGCVPYSPFGVVTASAAQRAYIGGTSALHQVDTQDVVAINLRGALLKLPAGDLAIATGFEYRRDAVTQTSDPLSQANAFFAGNYKAFSGSQEVKEGYVEAAVPLLKDQRFAHSLEFNGAVRYTDYSLAGPVTTWKVGGVWEPTSELLFRITRSHDIRAPDLDSLFDGGSRVLGQVRDKGALVVVFVNTLPNPNLVPEKADMITGGATYRPAWASGLNLSVDVYDIQIKGVIGSLGIQAPIDQCAADPTSVLCSLVHRNAAGVITDIDNKPLNNAANTLKTNGVDLQATYRRELADFVGHLPGSVTLNVLANYIDELGTSGPGIVFRNSAGNVSTFGPHWRGNLRATYDNGPLSVFVQERWIGSGRDGDDISDAAAFRAPHYISDVFYTDLTVHYDLPKLHGVTLTGSIQNLFNRDPPTIPGAQSQTNQAIYDVIGRYYRVNVRARF